VTAFGGGPKPARRLAVFLRPVVLYGSSERLVRQGDLPAGPAVRPQHLQGMMLDLGELDADLLLTFRATR